MLPLIHHFAGRFAFTFYLDDCVQIIGLAIYNSIILDLHFAPIVWKVRLCASMHVPIRFSYLCIAVRKQKLVGLPLTFEDFKLSFPVSCVCLPVVTVSLSFKSLTA